MEQISKLSLQMSLKTFFVGQHNLFIVLIDPGEMSQKKNTINDYSRELNGLVLDRSVLHLRQWFAVLGEEHCDVSWY